MRLMSGLVSIGMIAASLLLPGCSQAQTEGKQNAASVASPVSDVHPVSGLPIIPLTITHNGQAHVFRVEVARTSPEQARGLMFRTEMGADEGMIFPMEPPRGASFWMKNTVIPLDIIFIGTDGRISNISANATPYSLDPRPSDGLAAGVLELNGGRAAQLGIVAGDKVTW